MIQKNEVSRMSIVSKILLVDPLSFLGHINYNYDIYTALLIKNECEIIVDDYVADKLKSKGVPQGVFVWEYSHSWNLCELAKKYKHKLQYHFLMRWFFLGLLTRLRECQKNMTMSF